MCHEFLPMVQHVSPAFLATTIDKPPKNIVAGQGVY
jgi:hypothetical protein